MFWMKKPASSMVWRPSELSYFSSKFAYRAAVFFYHYMPAYILDFPALLMGKKTNRVKFITVSNTGTFIHQNRRANVHHQLLLVTAISIRERQLHSAVRSNVSRGSANLQLRRSTNQLAELRRRLLSRYTAVHLERG